MSYDVIFANPSTRGGRDAMSILPTPLHGEEETQGQIYKRMWTGVN